jgi:hypothetical protein
MGWAAEAAQRKAASEHEERLRLEKESHDGAIKDERGPFLFQKLLALLRHETEEYNSLRGNDELVVTERDVMTPALPHPEKEARITCTDFPDQPLLLKYSHSSHVLEYQCGPKKGTFGLVVQDGAAHLKHKGLAVKIDEVGQELLDLVTTADVHSSRVRS